MPSRNRINPLLGLKFEISSIEHDIEQMQSDLEYFQKQGLLIREAIQDKEQHMSRLVSRMARFQNIETRTRRDSLE